MNDIKFNEINSTGLVLLNRTNALNALNLEMAIAFKKKLKEWKYKKNISRIIVKGLGKAFCAGGDVKSISLAKKDSDLKSNFFKNEYELNYYIQSFPKPYLSIWNGIVMGGGVGLSIYGDYRIATINTKFAMPESTIGFFPDVGSSYFLSRMKNNIGLYIGLTGKVLNYYETYKLGLATNFIDTKNLEATENDFMENKKIVNDKLPEINSEILNNLDLINDYFSSMDIIQIFKNLNSDSSDFAKKTFKDLNNKCPYSLAITCNMFKKAKKLSFQDCLHMDYHLSQIMVNRSDFNNGVIELLVNKNQNKKWAPNSVDNINKKIKTCFNNISTDSLKFDI